MSETLIKNWNSVVSKEDKVYFLGDFSFGGIDRSKEVFERLNGEIHSVKGNHDGSASRLLKIGFESVSDFLYLEENIYLCHFYNSGDVRGKEHIKVFLNQIPNNGLLLHGHSHFDPENKIRKARYWNYDVGVDANSYFPVELETIKKEIENYGK